MFKAISNLSAAATSYKKNRNKCFNLPLSVKCLKALVLIHNVVSLPPKTQNKNFVEISLPKDV